MRLGVRRIGSARFELAWVDARSESRWLAVPGPLGEEAARIVAEEARILGWEQGELLPGRVLDPHEERALPSLIAMAVESAPLLQARVPFTLVGLRPTFAGGIVGEVAAAPEEALPSLAEELSAAVGRPVHLVVVERSTLVGGVGRPAREPLDPAVLRERLWGSDRALPGGLPRIGAVVETPRGRGIVGSIRTRDRTALVLLEEGEAVRVPIADLVVVREP